MPDTNKPVYLVDADSDPVVVRIEGRVCFQNSACLKEFIGTMVKMGKIRFVIDFQHCTSMDSTFLGVLASAALDLRQRGGKLILSRVGLRNLELLRNLGLHRLLTVDAGDYDMSFSKCDQPLVNPERSELEQARLVLEAHESLVAVDEENRSKFQDVLVYLKNRVEHK